MFKFRGKKWEELTGYEKLELNELIYKWALPIRIVLFPIMLLKKLYKWTYTEE